MRILVTGDLGFIGSSVVRRLIQIHDVIGCSRQTAVEAILKHSRFRRVSVDLTDKKGISRVLPRNLDTIIHLAAFAPVPFRDDEPFLSAEHNILATQNLLEYSIACGASRFIYASSLAVYKIPPKRNPIDEGNELGPNSYYAASKLGGERICNVFSTGSKITILILRLSYVYGVGMGSGSTFMKFLELARQGQDITVFNGGEDAWDFVHIDDVVEAVAKALFGPAGVYNIGSGRQTSILELAQAMVSITESSSQIIQKPKEQGAIAKRFCFNVARAVDRLGYKPRFGLIDDGIKALGWEGGRK